MVFHMPLDESYPMSSTSKRVETGNTISANLQSFSNQGCCTKTNSKLGEVSALRYSLPPFQQVDQHGVSDQII